jgi:hypothetical protein
MGLVIGALAGYDLKRHSSAGGENRSGDAADATGDQTDYGWPHADSQTGA